MCTGKPGIWLSRLRMGLSALGQHRFNYNLIEDYSCPHCGECETTFHYFFQCPSYSCHRTVMLNSLAELNHDTSDKHYLLDTILTGDTPHKTDLLTTIYQYMKATQRFK